MTPRENMIRNILCQDAQWMPVTVYVDPYNHPDPASLPSDLADLFVEKVSDWSRAWELILPLSEYLGVTEYLLFAEPPYRIVYHEGVRMSSRQENGRQIQIIETPAGELRQISESGFISKHYITVPEDIAPFMAFVASWTIEQDPDKITAIRKMKKQVQDNGMIWSAHPGTPLGMMYRFYTDIMNLVYMTVDMPEQIDELFYSMEQKYTQMLKFTLETCPEIDAMLAMDDTSTTIVSPSMFEYYNVALTNKRAEIVHNYGKFYMHHSCGLIHDLLPLYRKTEMNCVHGFMVPPIGNVSFTEGRRLLGDRISIVGGIAEGLNLPEKDLQVRVVRKNLEDARKAGHVMICLNTPDNRHSIDFMKINLEQARKYQIY